MNKAGLKIALNIGLRTGLLVLIVMVSGCAAKVVSSGPRSVVISGSDDKVADAQKLADKECQKHGRFAQLRREPTQSSDRFIFDCVQ